MFSTVMNIGDKYKIEGESILAGYEKWIDLTSISHQIDLPMTADKSSNSRTAGRPTLEDFKIDMLLNKAYPKLLEACGDGKNLGTVKITSLRVNEGKLSEIVTFNLENVYVADVIMHGGAAVGVQSAPRSAHDEGHALVSVRLNYDAITATYSETDNTGKSAGSISSKTIKATAS
ncbi:Hcp family type VI secretion system effector [Polaromonas sp.]|jgi:type VI secretion system Hcp family effector|uniref:Hcp family type VI secretion system effector n=1 Tax=Polaromonas sp. TaxID=1869339 RepID=UPI0037CAF3E7